MSEWTVPVRNVLFLALPRRALLLPAGLCTCFLGTCFLAGFILVAIGPSSSSHQFPPPAQRQILSIRHTCTCLGCAQMQPQKNCKPDGGAGSSSYISAGEPKCKGRAFLMRAGAGVRGCDRGSGASKI